MRISLTIMVSFQNYQHITEKFLKTFLNILKHAFKKRLYN